MSEFKVTVTVEATGPIVGRHPAAVSWTYEYTAATHNPVFYGDELFNSVRRASRSVLADVSEAYRDSRPVNGGGQATGG